MIQLVAIAVTVLLLYRFVPARRLRRRGALAGAILTAVGIWGTTKVLGVIFGDFSRYNVIYGSLAGVMTFLFFVYVIAWILLLGAEFAYAWSQPRRPARASHSHAARAVRPLPLRAPRGEGDARRLPKSRLVDRKRLRVRVERAGDAERKCSEVLRVPERVAVDHRDAERLESLLEDVLDRA